MIFTAKNKNKCDLHIHSNFSDSDAEVESIFKQARKKGLRCISITDHDTIDGINQALHYSKVYKIELIQGIELTAQHKDAEVHILGYFIDSKDMKLKSELAKIRELRRERILWMAEKLNSLNVEVDSNELMTKIGGTIPTRLHLGLYLVEKGKVKDLREAFKKYLSPGKPAYRSRFKFSVAETIDLIRNFGGLSFLAHPHMISDQSWIKEFIESGVNGLEIVYPGMSGRKCANYKNMVSEFNLLGCGGSDYHGSYKEYAKVGSVSIPYEWVERMKKTLISINPQEKD